MECGLIVASLCINNFFFDDGYSTVIINTRGFYIKNRDSGWTDFLIQNDHFK